MEILASRQNQHIRLLRSLYTKKGRDEVGLYPVEGVNIVKDIPADTLVAAYYFASDRYDELRSLATCPTADVFVVQPDVLASAVDTVEPQGVVALLPIPHLADGWKRASRLLVLDGVSDPGNAGTLIRTAKAAGFDDILILSGVDPYNPKVVRSSMGGIYRSRVYTLDRAQYAPACTTYALAMDGSDLFSLRPTLPFAVVVGSEAHGVSPVVRAQCDETLSIPMQGGVESLNAAVAGAIAMYVLNHNL